MKPIIIFPCSYFSLHETDADYADELVEARKQQFITCNFNYDEFKSGDRVRLNASWHLDKVVKAIYRGWMLDKDEYTRLYDELKNIYNIELINNPTEYINTHYFNNSYDIIKDYTPKTIWFNEGEPIDWNIVRSNFDRFIVKDYVKSVKGFGFPKYLESSMTDKELNNYIDKFKSFRCGLLSGGIMFKEYVELDTDEKGNTCEYRVFFMNNEISNIFKNPESNDNIISVYDIQKTPYFNLDSNFYCIDFALTKDGIAIPIEIGDGQVSWVPSRLKWSNNDLYPFYTELSRRFNDR